jgi:predicted metal-dependent phosphoesterase TrpH
VSYTDTPTNKFGQLIDFYIQPERASYWTHIIELSAQGTTEADEKLIKYILEAARLTGAMGSARNVEPADGESIELVVDQAGRKVVLNKGDRVITSFVCPPTPISCKS